MTAKLEANGCNTNSLFYKHTYLNKRLQNITVSNDFSLWKEIFLGVLQGSILGPLLFYICIYVSNYADDTVLYKQRATALTNLFLRKILRICKKSLIIIIIRISLKMNLALKTAQSYFLQKSMYY